MTTTRPAAPVPPTTVVSRRELVASSRLLLWAPVPAWIAIAAFVIRGESISYQPSGDTFGFAPLVIGFVCTVAGLVTLVLALSFSFGGAATRRRGILATTTWTAVVGVLFAGFGVVAIATGGRGSVECLLAGATALLPLVVALALRPVDRRP